jgi:hypothetical protein
MSLMRDLCLDEYRDDRSSVSCRSHRGAVLHIGFVEGKRKSTRPTDLEPRSGHYDRICRKLPAGNFPSSQWQKFVCSHLSELILTQCGDQIFSLNLFPQWRILSVDLSPQQVDAAAETR